MCTARLKVVPSRLTSNSLRTRERRSSDRVRTGFLPGTSPAGQHSLAQCVALGTRRKEMFRRRILEQMRRGRGARPTRSDIQILHIQRILFNELPARFNVFAHQRGEDGFAFGNVFEFHQSGVRARDPWWSPKAAAQSFRPALCSAGR